MALIETLCERQMLYVLVRREGEREPHWPHSDATLASRRHLGGELNGEPLDAKTPDMREKNAEFAFQDGATPTLPSSRGGGVDTSGCVSVETARFPDSAEFGSDGKWPLAYGEEQSAFELSPIPHSYLSSDPRSDMDGSVMRTPTLMEIDPRPVALPFQAIDEAPELRPFGDTADDCEGLPEFCPCRSRNSGFLGCNPGGIMGAASALRDLCPSSSGTSPAPRNTPKTVQNAQRGGPSWRGR